MDKLDKLTDFHKECIRNCINYQNAYKYSSKYPHLTDKEIIEKYKQNYGYSENETFTLKNYCDAQKLIEEDVKSFINEIIQCEDNSLIINMTNADWVISYINTQKCQSIEDICNILKSRDIQCSTQRYKGVQRKYPEWTKDEILLYLITHKSHHTNKIYYIKVNNKQFTLKELCTKLNLNYSTTRKYVIENDNININKLLWLTPNLYMNIFNEIVFVHNYINEDIKTEEVKTLEQLCKDVNINYREAKQLISEHSNISNELVIKYFLNPEKLTVKDKCILEGIPYKRVYRYKESHKDISYDQAIKEVKQILVNT